MLGVPNKAGRQDVRQASASRSKQGASNGKHLGEPVRVALSLTYMRGSPRGIFLAEGGCGGGYPLSKCVRVSGHVRGISLMRVSPCGELGYLPRHSGWGT